MNEQKMAEDSLRLADVFAKSIPTSGDYAMASVVLACLTLATFTAKKSGMTKLDVQKMFVSIWDKTGAP